VAPMNWAAASELVPDLPCSPAQVPQSSGSFQHSNASSATEELEREAIAEVEVPPEPDLPNAVSQAADTRPVAFSQRPSKSRLMGKSSHSIESAKEIDRVEWRRHLQRQVTEQLDRRTRRRMSETLPAPIVEASPIGRCCRYTAIVTGAIEPFVRSGFFQCCCTGAIVLNTLFIGYSTNSSLAHALSTPPKADPAWFEQCNQAFVVFYCIEITLRLMASGWGFCTGSDRKWHMFDTVLVLLSLAEELVQGMGTTTGGFLRGMRVLRMFRLLRLTGVMHYFRDLRVMTCSIMQSLGSLSWALILLLFIMYFFTIILMQGAITCLEGPEVDGEPGSTCDGIVLWYGSVVNTMYTLLASITGGVDWADAVRPLENVSLVYRLLYSFYMVFVVIGVLNVLTGIFVERACELSGLDRDLVIQSELKRNETFLIEMKKIFEEADADGSGSVSWEEFKGYLENENVKAYLSAQQLDAFDARTLFDILNEGNGNEMNIETFVVGCQRLKGMAKSVDVVAVLQETRSVSRKLKALTRQLEATHGGPLGTMDFHLSHSRKSSVSTWPPEPPGPRDSGPSATGSRPSLTAPC